MLRSAIVLVALLPLVGCERSAATARPTGHGHSSVHCRSDAVATLAASLGDAEPTGRRDAVRGLEGVCDLPAPVTAFLERPSGDLPTPTDLEGEMQFVASVCGDDEKLSSEPLNRQRAAQLYDTCGLGRLGLIEREAWLHTNPTSAIPFATMAWLTSQGVAESDAKAVAGAMLLRGQRTWGVKGLRVPVVTGALAPVPESAIEVALAPSSVFVGGTKILELESGTIPESTADVAPLQQALRAERDATSDGTRVVFAIVADEEVGSGALLRLAEIVSKSGDADVVYVAQSEPLSFGVVAFELFNLYGRGEPRLVIDPAGFELKLSRTSAPERIGGRAMGYDFDGLAEKAAAHVAKEPKSKPVLIEPDGRIPVAVLFEAVVRLRGVACESDELRCSFREVRVRPRTDLATVARQGGLLDTLGSGNGRDGSLEEQGWAAGFSGMEPSRVGLGDEITGAGRLSGHSTAREGTTHRTKMGKPAVEGGLSQETVRRIVRARIVQVQVCYEERLSRNPALEGELTIDFTVSESGKVSSAKVRRSTLGDDQVGACITRVLRGWTFPESDGGDVSVSLPFRFVPG